VCSRRVCWNSWRRRSVRSVVGEVRVGEAPDLLQARNTCHRGSLTPAHASSSYRALLRLETMATMAGLDLPLSAIQEQIRRGIEIVVHQERGPDGRRRIVELAERDPHTRDGYA